MSEEDKEKNSGGVKPLESKPGGKEEGTRIIMKMKEPDKEKEE